MASVISLEETVTLSKIHDDKSATADYTDLSVN